MAHCPPEQLADIHDIVDEVRSWERVVEKSFACFYIKAKGFMHFHVKGGERWADARCGKDWGDQIPLPLGATNAQRQRFLKILRGCYAETITV